MLKTEEIIYKQMGSGKFIQKCTTRYSKKPSGTAWGPCHQIIIIIFINKEAQLIDMQASAEGLKPGTKLAQGQVPNVGLGAGRVHSLPSM